MCHLVRVDWLKHIIFVMQRENVNGERNRVSLELGIFQGQLLNLCPGVTTERAGELAAL